jgi:DNA-binding transcriptional regulator YiaG
MQRVAFDHPISRFSTCGSVAIAVRNPSGSGGRFTAARSRKKRSIFTIVTQALTRVLGRPMTPKDTLRVLREEVGLSDQELARALNVTDRSVKRWRAGAAITTESQERLFDLARIAATLAGFELPPANVRAWFFHRSPFLEEQRPIDVFASEGFDAVQPAVAAIGDAAYA